MSRSGYTDELDPWALIRWRGAVKSALRGKRGQVFLRELAKALDAMPQKRLIKEELVQDGQVCALGSVAQHRGLDVSQVDPDDNEGVAATFGIARALACEVMEENDSRHETPEDRWQRMRAWVEENLLYETA